MELQIRGVSKTYANGVQALKDVTLMRMIATLQEPDTGTIHLGDPSTGSGQAIDVVNQKDEVRKRSANRLYRDVRLSSIV